MNGEAILKHLEECERRMRRDLDARLIRSYRYMTRTTPEQMRADDLAAVRKVLQRGWITKYGPDQADESGI